MSTIENNATMSSTPVRIYDEYDLSLFLQGQADAVVGVYIDVAAELEALYAFDLTEAKQHLVTAAKHIRWAADSLRQKAQQGRGPNVS